MKAPAAGRRQKAWKWKNSRTFVAAGGPAVEAAKSFGELGADSGKTSRLRTLVGDPGVRTRPDPSLGLAQRMCTPTGGGPICEFVGLHR